MKLNLLIASFFALAFLYTSSSCTKTIVTTVYDSTTIIKKDTTIRHDTTYINDTTKVLPGPKNPIIGQWEGTYTIDGNVAFGSFYFAWSIFPDGSLIELGGGPNGATYSAGGTWSLAADSTITVNIMGTGTSTNVTGHATGKYSSATGTIMNGHTNYTNGNPETHSFTLKRVGNQ